MAIPLSTLNKRFQMIALADLAYIDLHIQNHLVLTRKAEYTFICLVEAYSNHAMLIFDEVQHLVKFNRIYNRATVLNDKDLVGLRFVIEHRGEKYTAILRIIDVESLRKERNNGQSQNSI